MWAIPVAAQSPGSATAAQRPSIIAAPAADALPPEYFELRNDLADPARSHFDVATQLFQAGDYVGAFLKFNLAYKQSHDPRLLWSLAVCEKAQHRYSRALPLIARFLKEASAVTSDARRQEAEDLASLIENFVGQVHVETKVAGARVLIDDVEVGRTPLAGPLPVDMGDHRVSLIKRGYKSVTRALSVVGREDEVYLTIPMERDMPAATLEVVSGAGHWIALDGGIVGRDRWQGPVSPGKHLIKVSKADHKSREVPVDLSDGGRVTLWVEAQPLDPSEKSSRWPLVAVLGSATAAIAVVAYYSLQSGTSTPERVPGKLDTFYVDGQ